MRDGKGSIQIAIMVMCFMFIAVNARFAAAASKEYPYLYKSPRAMGMGGAGVAIGGRFDSVFYNPAGLSKMPENNWEVNILGLSAEVGENVIDFGNDMMDAFDTGDANNDGSEDDDQLSAVNEVLKDYRGEYLHFGMSDLMSAAKNSGKVAFGIGGLASVSLDSIPHQGIGADGLLEMHASVKYGGIGGVSYKVRDDLFVGADLKYMHNDTIDHSFTAREVLEHEDDLEDYITDEMKESGNALGVDVGVIYEFMKDSKLKPAVGFSLLNIGDMDFGDAGKIPMTANIGASIRPELGKFPVVVGLDYVDIFNNYDEDSDIGKRLRLGGEIALLDRKFITLAARAGLYQGYLTFGADLRLGIVSLNYTTYAEEVGAYAGQDDDRRHMVAMNIGW